MSPTDLLLEIVGTALQQGKKEGEGKFRFDPGLLLEIDIESKKLTLTTQGFLTKNTEGKYWFVSKNLVSDDPVEDPVELLDKYEIPTELSPEELKELLDNDKMVKAVKRTTADLTDEQVKCLLLL